MSINVSSRYYYQPEIPDWLIERCNLAWAEYNQTYKRLAEQYCGNEVLFYKGLNIDAPTLNDTINDLYPGAPTLPENVFYEAIIEYPPPAYYLYPLDAPIPPEDEPLLRLYAQTCGMITWQMLHIFIAEQVVRFGQFHHYGRK